MKNTCLNLTTVLKRLSISVLLLVLFLSFHQNSFSATGVPRTINFQGKLVNNPNATNVTDTSYTVIFSLYDKPSGGTTLWTETQTVTTTDGIFRVALGSVTAIPTNFNFNWDGLYLGIKVNSDAEMTPRVQMVSVPFAFNSQKVAGLTVQDSAASTGSTSATLKIGTSAINPITVDLGVNNVTFNSGAYNASTSLTINTTNGVFTGITLPTSGTLLTNTAAANQTVTSTQTSGNVLSLADSTALSSAITGLTIGLTSSTNSQNKTGISFDLSGGSSGTYFDLLGTGSTWSITRGGGLTVASCSGCGGGTNWFNLVSGNGVSNGGYITPINSTADFLLGSQATTSAKFAILNVNSGTPTATISGNFIAMPYTNGVNQTGGLVGIGTISPTALLDINNRAGFNNTTAFNITQANTNNADSNALKVTNTVNAGTISGLGSAVVHVANLNLSLAPTASLVPFGPDSYMYLDGVKNSLSLTNVSFGASTRQEYLYANGNNISITGNPTINDTNVDFQYVPWLEVAGENIVINSSPNIINNLSGTVLFYKGINIDNQVNGGSNGAGVFGVYSRATGLGSLDAAYGGYFDAVGADQSNYGLYVNSAASATNNYGLYINTVASGAGNYGIYDNSAAQNYFASNVGIGTTSPISELHVTRSLSLGANGKALAIFNQIENQDIITASASGTPRFTITNAGGIKLGLNEGLASNCLLSGGAGAAATWNTCPGGTNYWNLVSGNGVTNGGYLAAINDTADILLGGQSTASAALRVVGQGNPFKGTLIGATVSANTSAVAFGVNNNGVGDLFAASASGSVRFRIDNNGSASQSGSLLTLGLLGGAAPAIQSTANSTLAIGGSTTGNITLNPMNGTGGVVKLNGLLSLVGGLTSDIDTQTATTLKIGVTNASGITLSKAGTVTTIAGGLTVITGQHLIVNGDDFTDLTGSGLNVTSNALTIALKTSGNTATTSSNSGLEVSASGLSLLGGCTTGQVLQYNSSTSVWACTTPSVGSGTNFWDITNGLLSVGNTTLDFAIGGSSTGSADFVFGGLNPATGNVPTATFSGNLNINSRPNSSLTQQQTWTQVSGTAGTIGGGATTGIASVSASTIYNGSLYVGTSTINNSAEVYRYNGGTSWTKVSNATAGTIAAGGTSGIASVSAMTVFDGQIYIGTSKGNAAEVYRYDGSTNWTRVSTVTPGTLQTTTLIDGVSSLAVYGGRLYAGTRETIKAELYRYEGGTTWTAINGTAGAFVTTNTVNQDAITSMVTKGGFLYIGTYRSTGDAAVLRYAGGQGATGTAIFLKMNLAAATGSFNINNTATAGFKEVTAMTVYNGSLIVGLTRGPGQADILSFNDGPSIGTTDPDSWQRLNSAAGTITSGGTASIDSIGALTIYNGRLYVGTWEPGGGEIYRYENPGTWTRVSGASGTISGAAGATKSIWGVTVLQPNSVLYAMTSQNTLGAEVYSYQSYLDQSYNLSFTATPGLDGGVQSGIAETASIFFLASSSAIANNKGSQNGEFVFSNSIVTRNGAYDVAEDYPTRDDTLEPGDLISIDTNERGFVTKSQGAGDSGVIGVYSENPALELSQGDGALGNNKVVAVALAGRVPLKVTTENGPIKNGDYLTASSVPGVAMRATKAGVVVGQAMAPYNDTGVGKITVYVKSNSYNGTTADLFENIDTSAPNYEQDVLAKIANGTQEGVISEINTDRLIAQMEVISPKIVTDLLIAKNIKADHIEGLEILTNQISSLKSQVSNLASGSAVLGDLTASARFNLAGLTADANTATVSGSLNVKGNGLVEGMLMVIKSITTPNLLVSDFASFFGDVIFKRNVTFEGRPTFNSDTAGIAIVNKGDSSVEVTFDQEYDSIPIVTASISLDNQSDVAVQNQLEDQILNGNITYVVTKKTTKGFVIKLNQAAKSDINFSWVAISVKNGKITSSTQNKTLLISNPPATNSAAFESILNLLNSKEGGGG